jgi:hypothetical protein
VSLYLPHPEAKPIRITAYPKRRHHPDDRLVPKSPSAPAGASPGSSSPAEFTYTDFLALPARNIGVA